MVMKTGKFKDSIEDILSCAQITINGNNPWDIRVKNDAMFKKIVRTGSLGLGESYMDGWWECEKIDDLFHRMLPSNPEKIVRKNWKLILHSLHSKAFNLAKRSRAFQVGRKHYDLGNELYRNMLDKRMVYSCAYWKKADNLDSAQEAKLDLICRKLGLQPGDRILDIGCGWGSLVKYASEQYRVKAVGITISKEQAALARESCSGLPVEIRLQDYRDLNEKFDHIVSVGMFEHVGHKNYRTYMKTVHKCLSDDGLFLLHTIGAKKAKAEYDPWLHKYIFPNAYLPSMSQIIDSIKDLFTIEDWHCLDTNYDATLTSWFDNFNSNWHKLKNIYDDRFYRMWKYYLLSCAGIFRSRSLHVWQIVLSKKGFTKRYQALR
jgi:cyclopropane-fatty-acyl-phospholipid synthase